MVALGGGPAAVGVAGVEVRRPAATTGPIASRLGQGSIDFVPLVSLGAAVGALAFLFVRTRRAGRSEDDGRPR